MDSINKLKKGLPRPSAIEVETARVEAAIVLTDQDSTRAELADRDDEFHTLVRTALGFVVSEVFPSTVIDCSKSVCAPSIRAAYGWSRQKYGTLGLMAEHHIVDDASAPSPVSAAADLVHPEDAILPYWWFASRSDLFVDPDVDTFMDFWSSASQYYCMEQSRTEKPTVQLVGLAEALKVRVISKGPAWTYHALRPLQKVMHQHLRRHTTFHLVGGPIDVPRLEALYNGLEDHWSLSVDYKSATDFLHSDISEYCVDLICDRLGVDAGRRDLFKIALTRHDIQDDTAFGKGGIRPQCRGQLMGSVVSFPILCLLNAAVLVACRWVLDGKSSPSRGERLSRHRFVINGDDALYVARESAIGLVWNSVSRSVGFRPSPGKVYLSRTYANINSRGFVVDKSPSGVALLETLPFLNMGLVMGMDRSGGDLPGSDMGCGLIRKSERCMPVRELARVFSIRHAAANLVKTETVPGSDVPQCLTVGSRFNEMISLLLALPTPQTEYVVDSLEDCLLLQRARDLFVRRNEHQLLVYRDIPWFAPTDIGGPGFACVLVRLSQFCSLTDVLHKDLLRSGEVPLELCCSWFDVLCWGDVVPLERLSPTRLDLRAGLWLRRNVVEKKCSLGRFTGLIPQSVLRTRQLWDRRRCRYKYVDHGVVIPETSDEAEEKLDVYCMVVKGGRGCDSSLDVAKRNIRSLQSSRRLWDLSLTRSVSSRGAKLFERFWKCQVERIGSVVGNAASFLRREPDLTGTADPQRDPV